MTPNLMIPWNGNRANLWIIFAWIWIWSAAILVKLEGATHWFLSADLKRWWRRSQRSRRAEAPQRVFCVRATYIVLFETIITLYPYSTTEYYLPSPILSPSILCSCLLQHRCRSRALPQSTWSRENNPDGKSSEWIWQRLCPLASNSDTKSGITQWKPTCAGKGELAISECKRNPQFAEPWVRKWSSPLLDDDSIIMMDSSVIL